MLFPGMTVNFFNYVTTENDRVRRTKPKQPQSERWLKPRNVREVKSLADCE